MASKTTCDHCDLTEMFSHDPATEMRWCQSCVQQDFQLLNDAKLTDTFGTTLEYHHTWGSAAWSMPANLVKLRTIPKKVQPGFEKLSEQEVVALTATVQADPQQQFNDAWFDHYNSLAGLPGFHDE